MADERASIAIVVEVKVENLPPSHVLAEYRSRVVSCISYRKGMARISKRLLPDERTR